MEDDTDYVCKSFKNISINNSRPETYTPYVSPLIKKASNTSELRVPATPYTPYVATKALQKTPSGKENRPEISTDSKIKFNKLVLQAREFEATPDGCSDALRLYVEAMHICPGNTKLEKKIANLTKLVHTLKKVTPSSQHTTPTSSKAKRAMPNPLPPSLNDLMKNFKSTDSASPLHTNNNNKLSTQLHTPQREDKRTDATQNITQKPSHTEKTETKRENNKVAVESYDERDEEESEGEEKEDVEQMVEQPSGYFHDIKHSTYVLKSNEEDKELTVEPLLYKQLFDYQREGIKWMWNLYMKGKGGILGDDMGLGKTMQVVAFLSSMLRSGHISHALVVMPLSVLKHWEQELEKWGKGLRFRVYHGTSKKERADSIDRVISRGGILLTTYGLVLNQTKQLGSLTWDYVVLDEGHKIKDPLRKISQKAAELKSVNRILLTGTPIQNNMKEMWALFDWACNGKLLGNYKSFRIGYEGPIVKGLDRHASLEEKQIGESVSQELMRLVAPYFIRREKKTLFGKKSPPKQSLSSIKSPTASPSISTNSTSSSSSSPQRPTMCLTRKNDLVVWLTLSSPQKRLYEDFLGSEEVRNALNQTQSHLAALTRLKQICIHPCLLDPASSRQSYPLSFHSVNSAKIAFLMGLIPELQAGGHRLLIFSQYTTILDVIQSCITEMGCSFLRLDGSISSTAERQRRIQLFNTKKEIFCFLLTTGAGALGINLTTADRVLIFDPSWNTNDNQAVDRAYRVGQTRDVVVYRLILCGTIEEKMYRKQVYKSALQGMMQAGSQFRYFSKQELSEMFVLDDTESSATQQQLAQLHNDKIRSYPYLDSHLGFLHDTLGIVGVSHHDLLFSEKPEEVEPSEMGKNIAARAQSTLFDEQPTPRRRKTTKTPKKRKVVVADDDDGEESEFDYEPGVSSNPIHIEDDDETPPINVDEQEDIQPEETIEESHYEEPTDEEMQPEKQEEEESNDEMKNVGKRFRRLRRIVDDEEEEEETQHEETHHDEPQQEETTNEKESEYCEEEQADEVGNVTEDVEEELLEPLSVNACEMHSAAVSPFICYNCSCHLSEEQKLNYEEVLNKAKLYHREGNLKDALRCYYTALLICDDNLQLHACIIDLQNS